MVRYVFLALLLGLTGCASTSSTPVDRTPGMSESELEEFREDRGVMTDKAVDALRRGYVYVGMPAIYIREAIGAPTEVNESRTGGGVRYQYVYRASAGEVSYVYVEDQRVTSIQENGYGLTATSN